MIRRISLVVAACFSIIFVYSQSNVIDQIVAKVGNEIILKSDIENQYYQVLAQGYVEEEDLRCEVLEELLFQKLLYLQAKADSIQVTDREVESELDRRLSIFITQYGSEEKLEEYFGKSISEIKSDFRELIREQMMTQKVQQKLTSDIKVSPSDVRMFYESLPKDELPVIQGYYEFSEIVIVPKITKEEKEKTIEKLNNIRERIIQGESFATMAILYSEDPGSASKGGELGFVSRTDLVPEFSAVAFNLTSTNDVSRVVETEYGFHIIQLIERKGNLMNFRHILITPKPDDKSIMEAEKKAEEIYALIKSDSLNFAEAVIKYSEGDSKQNFGKVTNPYYGNTRMTTEVIDPFTLKIISKMKPGDISEPFLASTGRGSKVMRIIRLDNKVDTHTANLIDDYQEIQQMALQAEGMKIIKKWIENIISKTYIDIDKSYSNCKFKYADWYKSKK
ncbi:MAG: peptidylprolyl isomerase [Bacteroidales bacterium]|jgi:peptidyl-prolyl cis-trans isomerase SurA|nr:peptidylprolyl isomerase [Bacteroidales bacterium]HOL98670.1 peptidylprolyl isomerase [Bacteroidales bacterium]HUM33090.1 peptidylprolyl isomerase [Bacteroidales bacterium]